jgi:hypothetical protein
MGRAGAAVMVELEARKNAAAMTLPRLGSKARASMVWSGG